MIEYLYLGRVEYAEALRLQAELVELRTQGRIGNVLLLLEHPPVLTLGRNASRANILATDELLVRRGVTLHEINRGGDVTYHGPGQLIGYPIFDLRSLRNGKGGRLGPVDFVRLMEEALMRLCGEFGVRTERICGLTGVWCSADSSSSDQSCVRKATDPPAGDRKIAAIGIHVSRGVTSHGFAFNVTTDLNDFELINPCGITDRGVTSLKRESEREVAAGTTLPDLETMANRAARQFGFVFGEQVLAVESLDALLERARDAAENATGIAAQEFPAEDTPLQIPPEIARLRGEKSRPVSA
jgi:lipoyl(octanoyl) transferase